MYAREWSTSSQSRESDPPAYRPQHWDSEPPAYRTDGAYPGHDPGAYGYPMEKGRDLLKAEPKL